jgi:hypothetical protein
MLVVATTLGVFGFESRNTVTTRNVDILPQPVDPLQPHHDAPLLFELIFKALDVLKFLVDIYLLYIILPISMVASLKRKLRTYEWMYIGLFALCHYYIPLFPAYIKLLFGLHHCFKTQDGSVYIKTCLHNYTIAGLPNFSAPEIEDRRVAFDNNVDFFEQDFSDSFTDKYEGYCFLKILQGGDRSCFVQMMKNKYMTAFKEMCVTRSINVELYFAILRQINLECHYEFYRRAYWGENAFRKEISPLKCKKFCLIEYFRASSENHTIMDDLAFLVSELIIDLGYGTCRNKFLIEMNHVRGFERGEFRLSNWTNPDYKPQELHIIVGGYKK